MYIYMYMYMYMYIYVYVYVYVYGFKVLQHVLRRQKWCKVERDWDWIRWILIYPRKSSCASLPLGSLSIITSSYGKLRAHGRIRARSQDCIVHLDCQDQGAHPMMVVWAIRRWWTTQFGVVNMGIHMGILGVYLITIWRCP